jgi:hypothetical protein
MFQLQLNINLGACYFADNLSGMIGGVSVVIGNIALAQGQRIGDLAPFDLFLLSLAASNYFFGHATASY